MHGYFYFIPPLFSELHFATQRPGIPYGNSSPNDASSQPVITLIHLGACVFLLLQWLITG